jgi:hypothetical protein
MSIYPPTKLRDGRLMWVKAAFVRTRKKAPLTATSERNSRLVRAEFDTTTRLPAAMRRRELLSCVAVED